MPVTPANPTFNLDHYTIFLLIIHKYPPPFSLLIYFSFFPPYCYGDQQILAYLSINPIFSQCSYCQFPFTSHDTLSAQLSPICKVKCLLWDTWSHHIIWNCCWTHLEESANCSVVYTWASRCSAKTNLIDGKTVIWEQAGNLAPYAYDILVYVCISVIVICKFKKKWEKMKKKWNKKKKNRET